MVWENGTCKTQNMKWTWIFILKREPSGHPRRWSPTLLLLLSIGNITSLPNTNYYGENILLSLTENITGIRAWFQNKFQLLFSLSDNFSNRYYKNLWNHSTLALLWGWHGEVVICLTFKDFWVSLVTSVTNFSPLSVTKYCYKS